MKYTWTSLGDMTVRENKVRRAMIPRRRSEQWEEERRKGGWQLCWPLCSLRKFSKAAGSPKSPRNMPACVPPVPSMAGSQRRGTSEAGAHCSCKEHLRGRHIHPFQQNSCHYPYRAMILRFQYRGPPYKAERSKYSTPKCSGMGRIFLLSLFIFYNVQHKMPGLHF